jgi:hypothetical protein
MPFEECIIENKGILRRAKLAEKHKTYARIVQKINE